MGQGTERQLVWVSRDLRAAALWGRAWVPASVPVGLSFLICEAEGPVWTATEVPMLWGRRLRLCGAGACGRPS